MGSVSGWRHISTTATFRRDWCTLRPCVESKNWLSVRLYGGSASSVSFVSL